MWWGCVPVLLAQSANVEASTSAFDVGVESAHGAADAVKGDEAAVTFHVTIDNRHQLFRQKRNRFLNDRFRRRRRRRASRSDSRTVAPAGVGCVSADSRSRPVASDLCRLPSEPRHKDVAVELVVVSDARDVRLDLAQQLVDVLVLISLVGRAATRSRAAGLRSSCRRTRRTDRMVWSNARYAELLTHNVMMRLIFRSRTGRRTRRQAAGRNGRSGTECQIYFLPSKTQNENSRKTYWLLEATSGCGTMWTTAGAPVSKWPIGAGGAERGSSDVVPKVVVVAVVVGGGDVVVVVTVSVVVVGGGVVVVVVVVVAAAVEVVVDGSVVPVWNSCWMIATKSSS